MKLRVTVFFSAVNTSQKVFMCVRFIPMKNRNLSSMTV